MNKTNQILVGVIAFVALIGGVFYYQKASLAQKVELFQEEVGEANNEQELKTALTNFFSALEKGKVGLSQSEAAFGDSTKNSCGVIRNNCEAHYTLCEKIYELRGRRAAACPGDTRTEINKEIDTIQRQIQQSCGRFCGCTENKRTAFDCQAQGNACPAGQIRGINGQCTFCPDGQKPSDDGHTCVSGCTADTKCPANHTCSNGACRRDSQANDETIPDSTKYCSHCVEGQRCDINLRCQGNNCPECPTTRQEFQRLGGSCVSDTTCAAAPRSCTTDAQCGNGNTCVHGRCEACDWFYKWLGLCK